MGGGPKLIMNGPSILYLGDDVIALISQGNRSECRLKDDPIVSHSIRSSLLFYSPLLSFPWISQFISVLIYGKSRGREIAIKWKFVIFLSLLTLLCATRSRSRPRSSNPAHNTYIRLYIHCSQSSPLINNRP